MRRRATPALDQIVAYDCDLRAPDAPPVDGLAEGVCLHACLFEPTLIDHVDLGPLLVFPEHRELWRLLRTTRAQCAANDTEFYLAWLHALKTAQPENWRNYLDLILSVADRQSVRGWSDYDADYGDRPYTTYLHDFDWWLARLRRIAEARRGIQAAHEIAQRFWNTLERPFSGTQAAAILERTIPPPTSLADRVLRV